jgi:DNA-binding PadR family transcriptional regulator
VAVLKEIDEIVEGLLSELRRGTIVLCVLGQLKKSKYGYSLVTDLQEKGMDIKADTLYPLLRRLEKQELLKSVWDESEGRPRKYYELSEKGMLVLKRLQVEWTKIVTQVSELLREEEK